ncbi:MAG: hypothetical protein K6U87_10685 [Firmicutes bacterium]|nr:hypothetical protein [Bacillota bacterium]
MATTTSRWLERIIPGIQLLLLLSAAIHAFSPSVGMSGPVVPLLWTPGVTRLAVSLMCLAVARQWWKGSTVGAWGLAALFGLLLMFQPVSTYIYLFGLSLVDLGIRHLRPRLKARG